MNAAFAVIASLCLLGCAVSGQRRGSISGTSSLVRFRQEMGCLYQEHLSALGLKILLPPSHWGVGNVRKRRSEALGWEGVWGAAPLPGEWMTWICKMLSPRLSESENQFLVSVTQIRPTYLCRSWLASFFYYWISAWQKISPASTGLSIESGQDALMPKSTEHKRAPNLPCCRVNLTVLRYLRLNKHLKSSPASRSKTLRTQGSVTISSWYFISAVTSFLFSVTLVPTGQT